MEKRRVFSGTRATGKLHLGNYLGAIKGYLQLQNDPKYETIYMVVDLHAITTPYEKEKLSKNTLDVVLDYLACGLDPKKSLITVQSMVPEHTYLACLLSSTISVSRMQHLPTFKEKVKMHPQNVTMALLNYPILMAADILAYKAEFVPVGDDQLPHLEIAREIARKMNAVYQTDFPEPKQFRSKGFYIPSLLGQGKMSKSIPGSYINLTDDLSTIEKKLARVPTDKGSGKEISKESGVANLLGLVELFQGKDKRLEFEKNYKTKGIRYGDLKKDLAGAIYKELKPIQEKRKKLVSDPDYVNKVISDGAKSARKIAGKTLEETKLKMGF